MPLDDPATWAYPNPSYGLLAKQRDIARLYTKAKTPDALALFKADILGLGDWPPDESEVGSVIAPEVWQTMAATARTLVGPIAVAVDRSQDRKTWAICAAQRTTEGKIYLECAPYQHLSLTMDVVDKLVDIVCAWDPVSITIDSRSAAARQDGRVDLWHFVGSGHRSIVRHALLDGLLSIVPSGEKCTGVMGDENGCRRVGAAAWATGTPP